MSGPKSNEGAGCQQHKSDIINDRWTAGYNNNKEGSRQEQPTTNNCALKMGERWSAERAASNKKGKDHADEEDERIGGL